MADQRRRAAPSRRLHPHGGQRSGEAASVGGSDFARAQRTRRRANFALFLGPALVLLACFFVAPVIVDLVLAFTDMDRTLAVTTLTLENFERMFARDTRLLASLGITAIFVLATLGIGQAIVWASALSYLGLGAQPPAPEWGAMLAAGRTYLSVAWWMTVFPGLMIVGTTISTTVLGRALARRGRGDA